MKTITLSVLLALSMIGAVNLPERTRDCTLSDRPMPWEVASKAALGCGMVR